MQLRYPITSYASHHVDLTGGFLDQFENFVIRHVSNIVSSYKVYNALSKLTDRELRDIGLNRTEIAQVAKAALKGSSFQHA